MFLISGAYLNMISSSNHLQAQALVTALTIYASPYRRPYIYTSSGTADPEAIFAPLALFSVLAPPK